MAQVGRSGLDLLGAAFTAALEPEINGPGGCNEGFLRDDALLFVTFVSDTPDDTSPGTPEQWAAQAIAAKHGDPNAIVILGIVAQSSRAAAGDGEEDDSAGVGPSGGRDGPLR